MEGLELGLRPSDDQEPRNCNRSARDSAFTQQPPTQKIGSLVQVELSKARRTTVSRGRPRRVFSDQDKVVGWAAHDARNRYIGLHGEKLVFQREIETLTAAGRTDLAENVKHVALVNSAAGFDIASFNPDGTPKRIEVKTTQDPISAPFFISINKVLASREEPECDWIHRVFNFKPDSGTAEFFAINGDVEETCELEPTNFRAKPEKYRKTAGRFPIPSTVSENRLPIPSGVQIALEK